jgi:predicted transposase YbfD/YdcC
LDQPSHASFFDYFSDIPDPRIHRTRRYALVDLLFITLCATLCGAEDCTAIADFAAGRREWLSQYIDLSAGNPSHDTFSRVFALLDPEPFAQSFIAWVAAIQDKTEGEIVAIDGKTLRHSFDRATGKAALHLVSAWANTNGLVLGQLKTEDKSNEITAIPELLKRLDVAGCIITIDAMGAQHAIAHQIREQGADYLLAVKANQPNLMLDIQAFFERYRANHFMDGDANILSHSFAQTVDADHGRIETRRCWACDQTQEIGSAPQWSGMKSFVLIERERLLDGRTTREQAYYISSLPANADKLLAAVRAHWGIENSLHWVLDVTFDEDQSRLRKDNAPLNMATIRHVALNMLKNNTTRKASIRRKRNMAAWETDYLTEVLNN